MAGVTLFVGEGRMREFLHQLWLFGLMWIMTLHTVRAPKRLALVSLDQAGVLRIVTVDTERRRSFGQVIVELDLALVASLVSDVASFATHVQRGVAAAGRWDVDALVVATQAKILVLRARGRLQQLKLIVGLDVDRGT